MTAFSNFSRPTEVSFSHFLEYITHWQVTHTRLRFFVFKILDIQGSDPENTSAAFQACKCSSNCQKWRPPCFEKNLSLAQEFLQTS